MHKLLSRQLSKFFGREGEVPPALASFLEVVDAAYRQADHDRILLERSLDLTSTELLEANRELRVYASDLELRVAERTAQLQATNVSLELEIEERAAAERTISESEERYRSLFESSKDAIYISTPDGRLVDINPAGVELFGYDSAEELLMVDVGKDLYRHQEDRERFLGTVDSEGFVRDGELAIVRKDGEVINVLDTTSVVRDDAGEVIAYRGILRDVTTQRRLERELRQVQKMDAVGRLAGGVAHDFNNLLTAIFAYAEQLRRSLHDEDHRRSYVDSIADAAERGSALTSRLLAFGRRQGLRPVPLEINAVINDMRGLLRQVIPEDVELVIDLDPEVGLVQVDQTQFEQVVLNLTVNAGDAMPDGGRLTMRSSRCHVGDTLLEDAPALEPGDYVRLMVEDTGTGISDSVKEHIFEPFFTTKSAEHGTGLGLATVYTAVRECGGLVEVNSELGVGATFDVYLPVYCGTLEQAAPVSRPDVKIVGNESLLLVEDDPSVRLVLKEYLEDQGYSVLTADDGEAGLEVARNSGSSVDLVLSDVVMPKMNGIELARALRSETPEIKVLLISGHTRERNRVVEESLRCSSCSFLEKPFTPQTLVTKIRELLDE
jgi:PAS domain S-box-containing protein